MSTSSVPWFFLGAIVATGKIFADQPDSCRVPPNGVFSQSRPLLAERLSGGLRFAKTDLRGISRRLTLIYSTKRDTLSCNAATSGIEESPTASQSPHGQSGQRGRDVSEKQSDIEAVESGRRMTSEERAEYLALGVICRLGCLDDDGHPYVVPV